MLSYISLLELFILLSYLVRMAWAEWSSNSSRLLLYSWLSNTYYLADTHFFPFLFFSPCTLCLSAVFWLFVIGILKLVWVTLNQQFYHFGLHLTCFRKAMLFFLLIMEINILKKGLIFPSPPCSFSSSLSSLYLSLALFLFFSKKNSPYEKLDLLWEYLMSLESVLVDWLQLVCVILM